MQQLNNDSSIMFLDVQLQALRTTSNESFYGKGDYYAWFSLSCDVTRCRGAIELAGVDSCEMYCGYC